MLLSKSIEEISDAKGNTLLDVHEFTTCHCFQFIFRFNFPTACNRNMDQQEVVLSW